MVSHHIDRIFASLVGQSPPPAHPLASEVMASWKRCVHEFRLEPDRVERPQVLTATELKDYREPASDLIALAQPELDRLFRRLTGEDYVVLFTDTNGVTVDFRVPDAIEADARRNGLYLGAIWDERQQGTNGVGTCISIGKPVSIVQNDHFAPHNASLTCTVAPVRGPSGDILAVLDVSTPVATDHSRQRLILDIVLTGARRIETRIFRRHYHDAMVVRLSPDPDFIDAAEECLLAVDQAGRVIAADRQALSRLRQFRREAVLGEAIESVLAVGQDLLLPSAQGQPVDLRSLTGAPASLYARALVPQRPAPAAAAKPAVRRVRAPSPIASPLARLAGTDPVMRRSVEIAQRLIKVGLPILLVGETGAGKGALAQALHGASPRRDRPLVSLNCAALPESLIESELFGYQPGAFTGAAKSGARGKLREAQGGTLFLDEIGDMPFALQTRLLRALSEGEVTPLGGGGTVKLDVTVIAATHQPLEAMVAERRFREDLYHRIAGAVIRVPALRERSDREGLIAQLFEDELASQGVEARLADETMRLLAGYRWPGNIRQLAHVARFAVALCDGGWILPEHLPQQVRTNAASPAEQQAVSVRCALDQCDWNVSAAARLLGLSRATVHRHIRSGGLRRP